MNARRWSSAIIALACLLIALVLFLPGKTEASSPAAIRFIGFKQAADATHLALFEIENRFNRAIARNGYCWVNGTVPDIGTYGATVDIPPSRRLNPGESEILEIPLRLGERPLDPASVRFVRIHGVRSLSVIEDLREIAGELLSRVGIRKPGFEAQNAWEIQINLAEQ
jgi:hypothetical protein